MAAMYLARIYVQLKESVLDPQGQAVLHALHSQQHQSIEDVRIGKYIELRLNSSNEEEARKEVVAACESLLHNPVIESYRFDLSSVTVGSAAS